MNALARLSGRALGHLAPAVAATLARYLATRPLRRSRHPDPPDAEPVTFRFGLAGLRWGREGPLVLALHGWEGRAAQFRTLAARLVPMGYRVLALDAPAHGRSPGREADPVVFADALQEAAAELGPVHAVIGHSMGGASTLLALSRGLGSARVVTIAAPASLAGVLARMSRHLGLPESARRLFFEAMHRRTGLAPEQLDIDLLAAGLAPRPVLVVHDREDPVIPFDDARRIVAATGAQLLATSGLGHRAVLRDEGVLQRIAGFLTAPAA
ncbi:MAG TPA: alpha/beta fold hydrolase [Arenimonas sp.]|jgi:pimeloyl-ACP methyl ester carboxylesterase|nr:alpha/beta fold hydrolase [Arenimonas sp.]